MATGISVAGAGDEQVAFLNFGYDEFAYVGVTQVALERPWNADGQAGAEGERKHEHYPG